MRIRLDAISSRPISRLNFAKPERLVLTVLLLSVLLATAGLLSAEESESAVAQSGVGEDTAYVVIDGVKLFPLRGVAAFPAQARVNGIEQRIESVASDATIPVSALHFVLQKDRADILAGDKHLMSIVEADAALIGLERKLLAELYTKRIREAIEEYRYERAPKRLLIHGSYVLGATVLLILLVIGIGIGFRRFSEKALQRLESRLVQVSIRSVQILDASQVQTAARTVLTMIRTLLLLAIIYVYLQFALSLLPWTRSISYALIDMVIEPLKTMGNGILNYIDNIIFLIILFFVVRYILNLLRAMFSAIRSGRLTFVGFEREWAWQTYRLVRLLVLAFAVVVAYPYIPGSSSDAFKGVSLFLGVLFSLGSSSVISNVIAGYTMTYRRAFKVGDRVKIGEAIGDVDEIRLLVTHVRSLKNEDIVIPNSTILNAEVTNYSALARENGLILHTTVGIGYEVPWRQVEAMLLQAAQRTAGILTEPQPFVLQKSLGDYAVNYELNCYCDNAQQMMGLYSALHENIQDVFNEYEVQIMTPSYRTDTPQPKIVPKERWYAAPAKPPPDTPTTSE